MKGTILGLDPIGGHGAITGDDGQRYLFLAEEWKGRTSPSPGTQADFVADGSSAKDVYPVANPASVRVGSADAKLRNGTIAGEDFKSAISKAIQGDLAQNVLASARARPQVVLAAIIVLASVFLTWSHVSMAQMVGATTDASTLSFPSQAGLIKKAMAASLDVSDSAIGMAVRFGGTETLARLQAQQSGFRTVSMLLNLAYLAWLIPAAAILLLYREYTNTRNMRLELFTGGIALGFAILCYLGVGSLISAIMRQVSPITGEGPSDAAAELIRDQISLGWGAWVIAAAGIGLILTGLGVVRETPGLEGLVAKQGMQTR